MEKPEINVSYMVTTAETKEEAEFEANAPRYLAFAVYEGQAYIIFNT